MKKLSSVVVLVIVMMMPLSAMAQKIGYVNAAMLFTEYAKAKGIDKMIEKNFNGPKKELEDLILDIKSLEKEIKTNALLMTESKLVTSKKKLQGMVLSYREKGARLESELKKIRNVEMTAFRGIVFEVIKKYAKDKKYDLILNEGVMFAADSVNITDDLLALVNAKAK